MRLAPLLSWQESPTPHRALPQKTVSTLAALGKVERPRFPTQKWGEDCYRFSPRSLAGQHGVTLGEVSQGRLNHRSRRPH